MENGGAVFRYCRYALQDLLSIAAICVVALVALQQLGAMVSAWSLIAAIFLVPYDDARSRQCVAGWGCSLWLGLLVSLRIVLGMLDFGPENPSSPQADLIPTSLQYAAMLAICLVLFSLALYLFQITALKHQQDPANGQNFTSRKALLTLLGIQAGLQVIVALGFTNVMPTRVMGSAYLTLFMCSAVQVVCVLLSIANLYNFQVAWHWRLWALFLFPLLTAAVLRQ